MDFLLGLLLMFDEQSVLSLSPLSLEELERIDSTLLTQLDRHYLRLIAHCLACFKSMVDGQLVGALPSQRLRLLWCLEQPILASDHAFR